MGKKKKKIKFIETDQGKGEEKESEVGSKINVQLLQNNIKVQENKMFHVLTDFDFRLSKKCIEFPSCHLTVFIPAHDSWNLLMCLPLLSYTPHLPLH